MSELRAIAHNSHITAFLYHLGFKKWNFVILFWDLLLCDSIEHFRLKKQHGIIMSH